MPSRKVRHPAAGMSKPQREAFERIAIGQRPMAGSRTIAALLREGLIVEDAPECLGRDALGPIMVPRYYVPIPIHMQWCEWAGENAVDDEPHDVLNPQ